MLSGRLGQLGRPESFDLLGPPPQKVKTFNDDPWHLVGDGYEHLFLDGASQQKR